MPPAGGPAAAGVLGPIGRFGRATGKFRMAAQLIADASPLPAATGDQATQGRYLAKVVCSGCHGSDLRGDSTPDFTSPDLRIVAAYSPEAFAALMRTGMALGDRKLGLMREVALTHFVLFTDAEIAALYRYLHALPA